MLLAVLTLFFSVSQIKAPAETPYSVLAFAELARQAGVPNGVINVVLTQKNLHEVGKELCESPLVRLIFARYNPVSDLLLSLTIVRSTNYLLLVLLELVKS